MNIELRNVKYTYNAGFAGEQHALKGVSLKIDRPGFIALIGSTGSGKSTLIQMFNGLIQPTEGEIYFDGTDIYSGKVLNVSLKETGTDSSLASLIKSDAETANRNVQEEDTESSIDQKRKKRDRKQEKAEALNKKQKLRELRRKVGLVFQYPESQLFDETVLKDVMFGPKNLGFSEEEALERSKRALKMTGVYEEEFEKSPFELSGGQMRRVAIAGVLAMEPEILILDEPTAGLDPQGKAEILDCIHGLLKESRTEEAKTDDQDQYRNSRETGEFCSGISVVFVSHNMEEVAQYADRVIALNKGKIVFDGPTKEAFENYRELEKIGLKAPEVTYICEELGIPGVIRVDEAVEKIMKISGVRGKKK